MNFRGEIASRYATYRMGGIPRFGEAVNRYEQEGLMTWTLGAELSHWSAKRYCDTDEALGVWALHAQNLCDLHGVPTGQYGPDPDDPGSARELSIAELAADQGRAA